MHTYIYLIQRVIVLIIYSKKSCQTYLQQKKKNMMLFVKHLMAPDSFIILNILKFLDTLEICTKT